MNDPVEKTNELDVHQIVRTIVTFQDWRNKIPRNVHKLLEAMVLTGTIPREQISSLYHDIRPQINDERFKTARDVLVEFLSSGYTHMQKVIRPPLRTNIMSKDILLPKLLKEEYITGGGKMENNINQSINQIEVGNQKNLVLEILRAKRMTAG
jgi:hypothetical protein